MNQQFNKEKVIISNIFRTAIEKVWDQIIFQHNGANCHTTPKIISEIRSYSKKGLSYSEFLRVCGLFSSNASISVWFLSVKNAHISPMNFDGEKKQ